MIKAYESAERLCQAASRRRRKRVTQADISMIDEVSDEPILTVLKHLVHASACRWASRCWN